MGPVETDSQKDEAGMTLRERLEHDVKRDRDRPGVVKWGSTYYDKLRLTFEIIIDVHAALRDVVPFEKQHAEPSSKLVAAMQAAQRKPDKGQISGFLHVLRL